LGVYTEGRRHGLPPSELAEHLLIKRSTVSILSNRMVDLGWLERRPGENRRSFHLALTPAGTALLEKVVPMAIYLANITLEGFSTTQLQVMRRDLEQIEGNLRQFKS
jgi:DNA-binding MarR family transcriptional regulator